MKKKFNNEHTPKSSENCDKFSKSVSVEKWLQISPVLRLVKVLGLVAVLSLNIVSESLAECAAGSIACGDDCANDKKSSCHWELNSDGKLSISGSGDMKGYSSTTDEDGIKHNGAPWGTYADDIKSVDIKGVSTISDFGFYKLSNLEQVHMDDSVTSIGKDAFATCKKLSDVVLSNQLQKIGIYAFTNCSDLTSITLPDSLEILSHSAFNGAGLTSITLPENLKIIGNSVFQSTKLETITIPDSVDELSGHPFWGVGLKEIIIPDTFSPTESGIFLDLNNYRRITKIICQGDIKKCKENMKHYQTANGEVDMSGYVYEPENASQCTNKYVWNSGTGKCKIMNENQCNAAGKYYYNGKTCATRSLDGAVTCYGSNHKKNDGYCDRIRYTPAEAAEVLHNDNTNSVTITFKQ